MPCQNATLFCAFICINTVNTVGTYMRAGQLKVENTYPLSSRALDSIVVNATTKHTVNTKRPLIM